MSSERAPPNHDYVSFLLRLWREDLNGHSSWHAVLQNAQTHEEQYFVDIGALLDMLSEKFTRDDLEEIHHQQSNPISDGKPKEATDDSA